MSLYLTSNFINYTKRRSCNISDKSSVLLVVPNVIYSPQEIYFCVVDDGKEETEDKTENFSLYFVFFL